MLNSLKKKFAVLSLMVFSFLLMAVPAFASDTGTANDAVVQAFTSLKADVVATLGAVAGIAVAVMAIFLAWKYGRKIFSQIAR